MFFRCCLVPGNKFPKLQKFQKLPFDGLGVDFRCLSLLLYEKYVYFKVLLSNFGNFK